MQKRGFGKDVSGIMKIRSDYAHGRGPFGLEDTMKVSDEVQRMLRRCMEALAFFTGYPMRQNDGPGSDCSLDTGAGQVSLWPFITTETCPRCGTDETYFIDRWDTKRGTVYLKSFEQGHTLSSTEISDSLTDWLN